MNDWTIAVVCTVLEVIEHQDPVEQRLKEESNADVR
jgi:hypothetical protein